MLRTVFTSLFAITFLFSLAACNKTDVNQTDNTNSVVAINGKDLLKKHGCASCHKMDGKQVGPGYNEIALKYKNDATAEEKLINKVTTGGAGVWGTMPMPPMDKVKPEDIKVMVTYILSLAQ